MVRTHLRPQVFRIAVRCYTGPGQNTAMKQHEASAVDRACRMQIVESDKSEICLSRVLCGKWMPRKKTTCARTPGHPPPCMSAENMASRRAYRRDHPHRESPESKKRSNRKYRIASYGLTLEQFDRLVEVQDYACGMCHEPFENGQLIHVDHDHACCPQKNRSCGKCVRGLLCHGCNISLGHIEHRYAMARAYLDGPRLWAILGTEPGSSLSHRAGIGVGAGTARGVLLGLAGNVPVGSEHW